MDDGIASGRTIELKGSYTVSGPISQRAVRRSGHLHIHCLGDVEIRVTPGAQPFSVLLACHTATPNHSSISGGRLLIDLAGRCASGLLLRHDGVDGGTVRWGPVEVRQAMNHDADDVNENQAILIHGRYQQVELVATRVSGVDRSNATAGACKGISVSGIVGQVTLRNPVVEHVRCGRASADADGISVFAQPSPAGPYAWRRGRVQILEPVVRDCQGRSIKIQVSDALIDRPWIQRQAIVTIGVPDIDFQIGNGELRDARFDYRRRPDGSSPLHAAFYPISVQQQCTDRPMLARISGGVLRSELPLPRLVYLTVGAAAMDGSTVLEGFRCEPAQPGGPVLAFRRAVLEFSGAQAGRSAGLTDVVVRGVQVALAQAPLLGYTEADEAAGQRVAFQLVDNQNLAAGQGSAPLVGPVSGGPMPRWRRLELHGNRGLADLQSRLRLALDSVVAGSSLRVDLATCRLDPPPPDLPDRGIARLQVWAANSGLPGRWVSVELVGAADHYRARRDALGRWTVDS